MNFFLLALTRHSIISGRITAAAVLLAVILVIVVQGETHVYIHYAVCPNRRSVGWIIVILKRNWQTFKALNDFRTTFSAVVHTAILSVIIFHSIV